MLYFQLPVSELTGQRLAAAAHAATADTTGSGGGSSKLSSLFSFWNKSDQGGLGNGKPAAVIHSPHPIRKSRIVQPSSRITSSSSSTAAAAAASGGGGSSGLGSNEAAAAAAHPTRSQFQPPNGMCHDQGLDQPWMIRRLKSHQQSQHQQQAHQIQASRPSRRTLGLIFSFYTNIYILITSDVKKLS